jgi:hypothetical protein
MEGYGRPKVLLNLNKYYNRTPKKGFWLFKHCILLNYFGNIVSTKIGEFSLEFSCTIVETINTEKPSGPTFDIEGLACVAVLLQTISSRMFVVHVGCKSMFVYGLF